MVQASFLPVLCMGLIISKLLIRVTFLQFGNDFSTDWDKAWSSFKKQGKMSLFSQFYHNKYVSWNPMRSNYPISKEVGLMNRAERSDLKLWTFPKSTLAGAIVVVSLLLIYTFLAPMK